MTRIQRRWPARLSGATELRDRVLEAYAAPGRWYHDTRHLEEVLDHLERLLAQPEVAEADRDAVVLAAWFHDVVYDGAPDDEARSADLAESALAAAAVPQRLCREVARLVRLTRDHAPTPEDLAGQVLCDADLAVLAADPTRYADYVHGVRREYGHLDDQTFRAGRARVLDALLSRPALFHTPLAAREWEATARANLAREMTELTAHG